MPIAVIGTAVMIWSLTTGRQLIAFIGFMLLAFAAKVLFDDSLS